MSGNDDSRLQRERVTSAAHRLVPGSVVEFDASAGPLNIRFRVFGADGAPLIEASVPYRRVELHDRSDAELETLLHYLSAGRV